MRGAAGEAEEIYREPVATKQIGSPFGNKSRCIVRIIFQYYQANFLIFLS
jgi:hypothetical protein